MDLFWFQRLWVWGRSLGGEPITSQLMWESAEWERCLSVRCSLSHTWTSQWRRARCQDQEILLIAPLQILAIIALISRARQSQRRPATAAASWKERKENCFTQNTELGGIWRDPPEGKVADRRDLRLKLLELPVISRCGGECGCRWNARCSDETVIKGKHTHTHIMVISWESLLKSYILIVTNRHKSPKPGTSEPDLMI